MIHAIPPIKGHGDQGTGEGRVVKGELEAPDNVGQGDKEVVEMNSPVGVPRFWLGVLQAHRATSSQVSHAPSLFRLLTPKR